MYRLVDAIDLNAIELVGIRSSVPGVANMSSLDDLVVQSGSFGWHDSDKKMCVFCSLKDTVKDMDFMPFGQQQQHWQHEQQQGQQQQQQVRQQQQLLLATTSDDGTCQIWDVLTCRSVVQLELGKGECCWLASPYLGTFIHAGLVLNFHLI